LANVRRRPRDRFSRPPKSRRGGALLLATLLALSLVLPTLHSLAARTPAAGDVAHHAERCAQCEAFAHARAELAPAPVATHARMPFQAGPGVSIAALAFDARLDPTPGSPRSPPRLLSLS
jgi:hypothetical protein